MDYLYYNSQHKQIQAILGRLINQVNALEVPDRAETTSETELREAVQHAALLREAIVEDAGRLNRVVQELLSTFSDLPSIPNTSSDPAYGKNAPPPREAWASTQQLEAILNNLIAGVVVYDAQGVVKFANGYAVALFGFDPTRMQRDSLSRKLGVYGEDGKRVLVGQMPASIAAGGEAVMNRPLTIHGALGRAAHVLVSSMPVTAGGKLNGVVSVWNDVTGQHNLLMENEHQRELLEAIFNAISDAVMVFDASGQPIRANPATIQGLGFDPTRGNRQDIVRRMAISHTDGTPVELPELPSSLALSGQNIRNVPLRFTDPNGHTRAILSAGAPLRSQQGEITGAVTIWHDVTELAQVREQVENQRDRLEAILASINDEVWYCDPDGNTTMMNAVAVPHLGVSAIDQLNGPLEEKVLDRLEILNPDGAPRLTEQTPLLRSLQGETVRGEEIVANLRTGERMFRETIASPVRSKDDAITGAVAVVRDISRQKQQEAELIEMNRALRESEAVLNETVAALRESIANESTRSAELNAIMDAVPAILLITHDPRSRTVNGNRVADEFLRARPGGNLSKSAPRTEAPRNFREFQNGRELAPEELPLQMAAATGRPVHDFEEDVLFDDGSQAHLIGNVAPLLDESGQPAGAVAAFLDITERVENSSQVEVQRRLLEHREMERQKIARDLHDGPVQALGGLGFSLQHLQTHTTDPETRQMIAQMQADVKVQARELREVINELRPPALARFGLRKAIRAYTEDFQARHPDLQVRLELAEDDAGITMPSALPDSAVLALYRIFQESLTNITRHAQASQVTVRLSIGEPILPRTRPRTRTRTREITLEIEDNGIGLSPAFSSSIDWVELARQGHFGLVGMKERAGAVGGRLTIQTDPGQGTKVKAVVPWQ